MGLGTLVILEGCKPPRLYPSPALSGFLALVWLD